MRNTTQIKVRLSRELHGALQAVAAAKGITITALVKRAIREELSGFGPIPRDEEDRGNNPEPGGQE